MKVYFFTLLFIFSATRSCLAEPEEIYDLSPYCFHFTWLGLANDIESMTPKNCSALKDYPCVKPFFYSASPPNVTDMWRQSNRSEVICNLRPGHVCIKYTYLYNNAVINVTRFCGKMTENTKTAISAGCYSQQVEGHTIEACACVTANGKFPCNSSYHHKIQEFVKPEIIEPQHHGKKKRYKCEEFTMTDFEIDVKPKIMQSKINDKRIEESKTSISESLNKFSPMNVNFLTDLNFNKPKDWHNDTTSFKFDEDNKRPRHLENKKNVENVNRNIYNLPNQQKKDISAGLSLERDDDTTDEMNVITNLHKHIVNYQETYGISRTEFPFSALINEMAQITFRCLFALLYTIISLSPVIQIFIYILRFALDRIIDIQETTDYYQIFSKCLILGIQLLIVLILIGLIFAFIVLPTLQMSLAIFAKIFLLN